MVEVKRVFLRGTLSGVPLKMLLSVTMFHFSGG